MTYRQRMRQERDRAVAAFHLALTWTDVRWLRSIKVEIEAPLEKAEKRP